MLKLRQKFRIANIVMWGKVMPSKCLFVDIWNTPYLQESWADNSFWPTSLRCLPKEKLFWNNRRVQLIVGKTLGINASSLDNTDLPKKDKQQKQGDGTFTLVFCG